MHDDVTDTSAEVPNETETSDTEEEDMLVDHRVKKNISNNELAPSSPNEARGESKYEKLAAQLRDFETYLRDQSEEQLLTVTKLQQKLDSHEKEIQQKLDSHEKETQQKLDSQQAMQRTLEEDSKASIHYIYLRHNITFFDKLRSTADRASEQKDRGAGDAYASYHSFFCLFFVSYQE